MSLKTLNFLIALGMGFLLWLFVFYKAVSIPLVHDELATIVKYTKCSIWQIIMYPDARPNNHILNTLLAKLCIALFGQELWVARLPNVLFFWVYFYPAYQIAKYLGQNKPLLFFAGLVLLLGNPFLLDFFSLGRGYGISNALLLLTVFFLMKGFVEEKEAYLWGAVLGALLAAYANFTLLLFACAVGGLVGINFLSHYVLKQATFKQAAGKIIRLGFVYVLYVGLIVIPIRKMMITNQFVYWTSNGFFEDTLLSSVNFYLYYRVVNTPLNLFIAFGVILIFSLCGAYTLYMLLKKNLSENLKNPLLIFFCLLSLTVAANILQTLLLKTPNLNERTAVWLYPLWAVLCLAAWQQIGKYSSKIGSTIALMSLIITSGHLFNTLNFTKVREWDYDELTYRVIAAIQEPNPPQAPVKLATNWLFHHSFNYQTHYVDKDKWIVLADYNTSIDTVGNFDYYYVFRKDMPELMPKYELFKDFGWAVLLKRK
jgi:hypothetical protein